MTQVNNTINGLWVVIFSPIVVILWLFMNRLNKEPNTVVKFGFGFVFLVLSVSFMLMQMV
jgi:POT family proton-dependent oligopeptide transporter